jgi:hypothetical protein
LRQIFYALLFAFFVPFCGYSRILFPLVSSCLCVRFFFVFCFASIRVSYSQPVTP